jgi:hypothetical protein
MTSRLNFERMSRDELAQYIVAHRDTPDGLEARRVFIRRLAQKADKKGIELQKPTINPSG